MQRTEKYFENDAFRKTAAGVILAAEADAKTGDKLVILAAEVKDKNFLVLHTAFLSLFLRTF